MTDRKLSGEMIAWLTLSSIIMAKTTGETSRSLQDPATHPDLAQDPLVVNSSLDVCSLPQPIFSLPGELT
jgi:hypothetical protein